MEGGVSDARLAQGGADRRAGRAPLPALHPQMADVFRKKATSLAAGLEHDEQRDAARKALRGFLERIEIPPGNGLLQVVGNLGSMLTAAQGRAHSQTSMVVNDGCGGVQPPLFAPLVDVGVTRTI